MRPTVSLLSLREVSDSAYILRFERGSLDFQPGQYVSLGEAGSTETREYSIYSGVDDPFIEVLIKEVAAGSVSKRLRRLSPGSALICEGPFGFFTLGEEPARTRLLWVATGTGIAPFHSFAASYSGLDYLLLHGIRAATERYEQRAYSSRRYLACISRESEDGGGGAGDEFGGRVTAYLQAHPAAAGTRCYLCGNSEMIFEVFDLLKRQGIPTADIAAEVYF